MIQSVIANISLKRPYLFESCAPSTTLRVVPLPRYRGGGQNKSVLAMRLHPSFAKTISKSLPKREAERRQAHCLWSRIVGCGSGLSGDRSPLGAPPRFSPEALP
jgi:hypothetical protein